MGMLHCDLTEEEEVGMSMFLSDSNREIQDNLASKITITLLV